MNATHDLIRPDRQASIAGDDHSSCRRPAARRTKIICTLGPATADLDTLRDLVAAGMDVARFNFSHGSHDFHRRLVQLLRQAAAELERPVALMQDLQGQKLRIGTLPGGGVDLTEGEAASLRWGTRSDDPKIVPVPHVGLLRALRPFDRVLFGDGEIELSVRSTGEAAADCEVVRGGRLGERKGISVPGRWFPMPVLSRQDLDDIAFGHSIGFDFLAVSFVRTAQDVKAVRMVTRELGWPVQLVAKLETREAMWDLELILDEADAVMVARGDLAVQLSIAEVPVAQKTVIRSANNAGVPVITATQMLESMVRSAVPTRAEATDVANAVWDGTDAVMLSAETSSGEHPVDAVRAISELCFAAERNDMWRRGAGAGWFGQFGVLETVGAEA